MRLLKYYDASLYKQVHDLIPARANATVGILIEPTVLERDKIIIGKEPRTYTRRYTHNKDTAMDVRLELDVGSKRQVLYLDKMEFIRHSPTEPRVRK